MTTVDFRNKESEVSDIGTSKPGLGIFRESQSIEAAVGYGSTVRAALTGRRALTIAIAITLIYMGLFLYFAGLLRPVDRSQFLGVSAFPHLEIHLNPLGYLPYLAFQPHEGWYLEVNLLQAVELSLVGTLAGLNIALSILGWRLQRALKRHIGSSIIAIAPVLVPNGACVACGGIPAALGLVPTSVAPFASGLLAFLQFYGVPILLAIVALMFLFFYSLYRVNLVHAVCEQRLSWPTTVASRD